MARIKFTEKLKREWVKALRSGDFKQGQGALQVGNRYCCLGVLNKLAGTRCPGKDGYLSGIHGYNKLLTFGVQRKLSQRNDDGLSFKAIATYIENHVKPGRDGVEA